MDALSRLIRAGKGRNDLSPLLAEPGAFAAVVRELARPFAGLGVDRVVGIEAAGLPFAAGVALTLGSGLVLIRAAGKAAGEAVQDECIDYTRVRKRFELVRDAIKPRDHLLLVDDWSETGEQLSMARRLAERSGGVVVGAACIHFDDAARGHAGLQGLMLHAALSNLKT